MVFIFSGCVSAPVVTNVIEEPVYHKELDAAIHFVADRLTRQIPDEDLIAVKLIPVDLFFNEQSAEGVASAKGLQQQMVSAMSAKLPNAGFTALTTRNIQMARWVLLAGYANIRPEEAGRPGKWVRLKVVLADVKTGSHVASVATYLDAMKFDGTPSRFSKESPMYLTDAAHRDRTAILAGEKRPLSESMRVRAELSEAIEAYENEHYADADMRFRKLLVLSPNNASALSGLYQVLWRQDKKSEAEKIFGQLASAGIDVGILSAKLLFKLGSVEFIDEGDLALQYQIWLRAIAQQVGDKKVCLDVTGHASVSGSAEFNDKLSLSRSSRITARMQQFSPAIKSRLKAHGVGSREAIVGTGADDSSDAIDRRVAFAVRACE